MHRMGGLPPGFACTIVQPRATIFLTLQVTCEGKDGEQEITANVADSIGKMKHAATVAFDAPIEYSVFCNVSPETPEGTMLSRTHLTDLKDGDHIHLKPAPAKA